MMQTIAIQDRFARGWLLHNTGRYELAVQEVLARLAEQPDDVNGYILLAYCQNELRAPEALATARKAIALAPNHSWSHYAFSIVVHREGRIEEAVQAVRRAIELDCQEAHFFGQLAFLLIAQKRWRTGLAAAEQGLSIRPTDRICLSNRGVSLRILGQIAEAARTLEVGLQLYPEDAFLQANWGWILLHRNEARLAEFHFREALRLDPFVSGANPKKGLQIAWIARTWLGRRFVQWWLWDRRIRDQIAE